MSKSLLLLVGLGLSFSMAMAQTTTVTRGPFLQMATPNSMVIRWRTSIATDSRVFYGLAQGSLTSSVSDGALVTEHEINVTGLSPDTKYFYSIGTTSATLAGNDADHFFNTHPLPGTERSTRIWVIGDAGTGSAHQAAVRDAYYNYTGTRHTDLWLQLGDNAYSTGTDAEYQTKNFNIYPTLYRKSPSWPTQGNHDSGPDYIQTFTLPKNGECGGLPSGQEQYYSFNYGNIHFVSLCSQGQARNVGSAQWLWASNDLAQTTAKWIVVFFHQPPYSKGSHDSDADGSPGQEFREWFLPLLEQYGVDLVLCGHSHSYERSYFIDGHYGLSTTFNPALHMMQSGNGRSDGNGAYQKSPGGHQGAVYAVAGSSGLVSGGSLNHPAMFTSQNILGSMVLDINGSQLDAKFLTNTGQINDYFTIIKTSGGPQVLTSITVSPATTTLAPGNAQQFTAIAKDQNGLSMSPQPSITWSFNGSAANGSVNSLGLFTAGSSEGGPFTISATSGSISGSAQVSVAASTTVSFQEGVNGYAGTADTKINEYDPTTAFGNHVRLDAFYASPITSSTPENIQTLLKFDLSSVPSNAEIDSADIKLYVTRVREVEAGDVILMNKVTSAWTESTTWSSGVPSHIASGVTPPALTVTATNEYVITGLKNVVQEWVGNPSSNHGVIFYTTHRLNYSFASSEIGNVTYRPKIQITYRMPSTNPDTDNDGLPDSWESTHFGSLNQNASGDPDGDGLSNEKEYAAGTVPVDRNSRFAVTSESFTGGTSYTITWQSVAGKVYEVEASTSLTGWSFAGSVTASGTSSSWTDSAASGIKKFYRVKLP